MLRALVKDLTALPGLEVWVTRDTRLPTDLPGHRTIDIGAAQSLRAALPPLLREVEAFWPIAPETDGALERLCGLASGCRLLASDHATLALTASKFATAKHLAAQGVPSVPTWRADGVEASSTGWVAKPDDGAGCEETRRFAERHILADWLDRHRDAVVQPYLAGTAASLSLLCREGRAWLLACNRQRIAERDGWLRYEGSDVGVLDPARFNGIAEAIAAALPGLWGMIGVDLVDGPAGPRVLEINPRLTTSYVALGQAIGVNPAWLVLSLLERSIDEIRRPLRVTPGLVEIAHG
ncbi:MAG: ATP-grasp domain-containing protein [Pseudomonadota bacterium]